MMVKPAVGLIVRDPISRKALPPDGATVPETTYWRRRLAAGDVVLVAEVETPAIKTRKEAK